MIPHHDGPTPAVLRLTIPRSSIADSTRRNHHLHDVGAGAEPNERRSSNRQHDRQHDLRRLQSSAEALAANGRGNDDAGDDGDGAGGKTAHPRAHAPPDLALGHDLAGHGAHDAGGRAGQQQRQREDGGGGGRERRAEQRVHREEVRVRGRCGR